MQEKCLQFVLFALQKDVEVVDTTVAEQRCDDECDELESLEGLVVGGQRVLEKRLEQTKVLHHKRRRPLHHLKVVGLLLGHCSYDSQHCNEDPVGQLSHRHVSCLSQGHCDRG